ncbi:hypothetical protein WICPIJ_004301 [Wickerhamomyces pijperi]|uniref:DNA replication complex GINS protein PSF3 n=1 Tax=Wickerhamomyces pijperi TaxID=599730 RepID=A0A9P8Q862_WICPI|nr:hypothetical protein WICPIJ_004301 [Wickerhamomyces pijperi]
MPSYYDLDDIISESQRIPCKIEVTLPNLGILEGNPGQTITKDTKLELPIWIATVLALTEVERDSNINFITLLQPDAVSKKVINTIKTSPTSLDLHSVAPHYYSFIEKWAELFNDKDLVDTILVMLKERAMELNRFAHNLSGVQKESNFLYSLDEFEKLVYRSAHSGAKNYRGWVNGEE